MVQRDQKEPASESETKLPLPSRRNSVGRVPLLYLSTILISGSKDAPTSLTVPTHTSHVVGCIVSSTDGMSQVRPSAYENVVES